ncbi:hypothetical protein M9Y10_044336 [Tritrichomonas musculus]|uniref:Uncharacterized protein n=1 Tax=Tritrichomonas musculus TaxID=1915356 RepID=A0ABR2K262_9EUKA
MNVSLLDFQKIHPPIHTPRFSVRFRTQGSNTPQVGCFKNQFIGIEINLLKEIQDIESIHKPTSKRKKKALLNALEDAGNLDYGFKDQVLYALSLLNPIKEEEEEEKVNVFRMTSAKDLIATENELTEKRLQKQNLEKRLTDLREKLKIIDDKEKQMKEDIAKMKEELMYKNHRFEGFRNIRDRIEVLQMAFDSIFNHSQEEDTDSATSDLMKENHRLRKNLMKLKYELYTVNQISRRIKFLEDESDIDDD